MSDGPSTGMIDATSVSFVDDDAYAFSAPTTDALVEQLQQAVPIIIGVYKEMQLPLNFARGKTSLLIQYRGKGADKHKRRIQLSQQHAEEFVCGLEAVSIAVVESYKHMGGMVSVAVDPLPEARYRSASMWASISPLVAKVFGNKRLPIEGRKSLARSLAWSRLFFNAGTWSYIGETWMKCLHNRLHSLYVCMAGAWRDDAKTRMPFAVLCKLLDAPTAQQYLSAARLRQWARMVRHAPPALWALAQASSDVPTSWACRVFGDLVAIHRKCTKLSTLPSPTVDLRPWQEFVKCHPKAWSNIVAGHFLVYRADAHAKKPAQEVDSVESDLLDVRVFRCDICDTSYGSARAVAAHNAQKHGYRRNEVRFAEGDTCQRCMKVFHTRPRLAGHFVKAPACLAAHMSCFVPLSDEDLSTFSREDAGARTALRNKGFCTVKAEQPSVQVSGPAIREAPVL
jgi:hypothetical protein